MSANELFDERFEANAARADRVFAYLLLFEWAFGIFLALMVSPQAWQGRNAVLHAHVKIAIGLGGLITVYPVALALLRPGARLTRNVIAIAQMLWSSLLIHLTGGRIETHFHVFGSLAFLAFYRDWTLFVPATVVVAADHLIRQIFWPESVFGVLAPESWRFLEHAGWVVFEDIVLVVACVSSKRDMVTAAEHQTRELAALRRQELRIASQMQTSLLPQTLEVAGLDVAAKMVPAAEVGGDYYEVIPVEGGCWIGIGDVAGHGLQAGLVMLQAQSAISALVASNPNAAPSAILRDANSMLYRNVRQRLRSDEHMTLSLIRYYSDGRLVIAGAHEIALLLRAGATKCERLDVRGTWLGAVPNIAKVTVDTDHRLGPGDMLVLYTDGLTEGANAAGERFELDRLCAAVESLSTKPVKEVRDNLLDVVNTWTNGRQEDDLTVMVLRQQAPPVA